MIYQENVELGHPEPRCFHINSYMDYAPITVLSDFDGLARSPRLLLIDGGVRSIIAVTIKTLTPWTIEMDE